MASMASSESTPSLTRACSVEQRAILRERPRVDVVHVLDRVQVLDQVRADLAHVELDRRALQQNVSGVPDQEPGAAEDQRRNQERQQRIDQYPAGRHDHDGSRDGGHGPEQDVEQAVRRVHRDACVPGRSRPHGGRPALPRAPALRWRIGAAQSRTSDGSGIRGAGSTDSAARRGGRRRQPARSLPAATPRSEPACRGAAGRRTQRRAPRPRRSVRGT